MIVVKIELHTFGKPIRPLGLMVISNDGTSKDPERGSYLVQVGSKRQAQRNDIQAVRTHPLRIGRVLHHPRQALNVWRLIARALKAAFPEENVVSKNSHVLYQEPGDARNNPTEIKG